MEQIDIENKLTELESRIRVLEGGKRPRRPQKYAKYYDKLSTMAQFVTKTLHCQTEADAVGVAQGLHSYFQASGKRFKTMRSGKALICYREK